MNLENMCLMAARYADRSDELVKTADADGTLAYRGEALSMFAILRDAINEAYAEIADTYLLYDARTTVTAGENGAIDITTVLPNATAIIAIYAADGKTPLPFTFETRFTARVEGVESGERVCVRARIRPNRLENESDEPVFPESAAGPMVYVALAAARLFQSERKFSDAQSWTAEYRRLLRAVKPVAGARRRLPRRPFR